MNPYHPYKLRLTPVLKVDPNPCLKYRWKTRCTSYNGAHVCEKGGGHTGWCRCGACDALGRWKDMAAPLPREPAPTDPDVEEYLLREEEHRKGLC